MADLKKLEKKLMKKAFPKKKNLCKYCGKPTKSIDPNVLCEDCRMLFGHTFFDEL
jgi:hypothetical protein